jgi:Pectate lyase superfamily protein
MRIRTSREKAVLNSIILPTICTSLAKFLAASTHHFLSYRSVRNFIIDVRRCVNFYYLLNLLLDFTTPVNRVPPGKSQGTGIYWQVSQSTSLMNIVFEMSTATNTSHQGICVFFLGYSSIFFTHDS